MKKIQEMTYAELKKANFSEKYMRRYYREARRKANRRYKDILRKAGDSFGKVEKVNFLPEKDIITTDNLLREIHDVNKYLSSDRSTITGLKFQREKILERFEKAGFDVDESNYPDLIAFLKWFYEWSGFTRFYDSDSEELKDAFNSAESATPEDWRKALEQFAKKSWYKNNKS